MSEKFPRTRTGCLTCRQRKKKCDETKPLCKACERNKLDCSWPSHIRRRFGLEDKQKVFHDEHCHTVLTAAERPAENSLEPASSLPADGVSPVFPDDTPVWSWGLNTFLGPVRAALLSPVSNMILSHYLEFTAPKLAPAPEVPFVSWILPVAYNDDLLMHSILALSGAHLSYRSQGNIEIQQAACSHYCLAVRTLFHVAEDETLLREPLALLRVTLAVMILCHCEVLSGNHDGSLFTHVRASRHLLLELRKSRDRIETASERRLYGFVMEIYSYIVLCNTITPFGMNHNRTLVHDPFVQSVDELRDFGAFGSMFGGGHGLFELISPISLLAARQESPSPVGDDASLERYEIYKNLKSRIQNWDLATSDYHDDCLFCDFPLLQIRLCADLSYPTCP
ncbi:fungal-specific transcription factor domain-containing protein [Aspergillus floccosus]